VSNTPTPGDGTVRVEVFADADAVARRVADLIAEVVSARPDAVLTLPTGSTPVRTYSELARRVANGELDVAAVRVVLLDEYVGLEPDDQRSMLATLQREATRVLGIPDARVLGPHLEVTDPETAAARFDADIAALGGVDLALLGIGRNGHVGFNEPGTPLDMRSHVANLTATTRADNARSFGSGDVPAQAVTQGPATIAAARRLILMATGGAKAPAVAAGVTGPVSPHCPASIVQVHADAIVVVDTAAAQLLGGAAGHG
jgi:glucosamine-6-phosphate deaminase